jgi:pimeloyl-ACP methyl ester carboxylesterase
MYDEDGGAFNTHRATVRQDVSIAYVHEGIGGVPILLLHGWPGSKRLWWRNIGPLAVMGFEVIVPDQRGFADSGPSPAGPLDVPASARDMQALVKLLGHDQCIVAGGDMGSTVAIDMSLRFPGFVKRQLLFNGATPHLPDLYKDAGLARTSQVEEIMKISDHLTVHGAKADELTAQLDTAEKRRNYVESFFTGRKWREGGPVINLAGPGNFDADSARFLAESFEDVRTFRASLGFYEGFFGSADRSSEAAIIDRRIEVETMILWGMEDEIVGSYFPQQLAVACRNHVGPFFIEKTGHFVQWEAADIFNNALRIFCRDLL